MLKQVPFFFCTQLAMARNNSLWSMVQCCALRIGKDESGNGQSNAKPDNANDEGLGQNTSYPSRPPSISHEVVEVCLSAEKANTVSGCYGKTLQALGDVQGILYIHSTVKGFNVAGENEAVVARVVKAITDLGSHRDEFAKQILRQSRPSDSTNLDLHSLISAADQISTPAYTGESGLRDTWDVIVPQHLLQGLELTQDLLKERQDGSSAKQRIQDVIGASAPCELSPIMTRLPSPGIDTLPSIPRRSLLGISRSSLLEVLSPDASPTNKACPSEF